MKKLSMLGIVGGAALLAAVPFSLQSNVGSAVPLLTVSHADAQTAHSSNGTPSSTAHGSHGAAGDTARRGDATVSPAAEQQSRQRLWGSPKGGPLLVPNRLEEATQIQWSVLVPAITACTTIASP